MLYCWMSPGCQNILRLGWWDNFHQRHYWGQGVMRILSSRSARWRWKICTHKFKQFRSQRAWWQCRWTFAWWSSSLSKIGNSWLRQWQDSSKHAVQKIRPMQFAHFAFTAQIWHMIYAGTRIRWKAVCLVSVGCQRPGRKVGCGQLIWASWNFYRFWKKMCCHLSWRWNSAVPSHRPHISMVAVTSVHRAKRSELWLSR